MNFDHKTIENRLSALLARSTTRCDEGTAELAACKTLAQQSLGFVCRRFCVIQTLIDPSRWLSQTPYSRFRRVDDLYRQYAL